MGAEAAVLSTIVGLASQQQARRQGKREARRREAALDVQLAERKRTLEDERNRKAAYLRARYGASGIRTNSRSANNLLRALNQNTEEEINYLQTARHLKTPIAAPNNEFGNFLSVLNSLRKLG